MMAALFVIFTCAIFFSMVKQRSISLAFIVLGLLLSFAMFCHHATDVLQINL